MSYEAWLKCRNVDASKKIFVATENILFDFELFIGDRHQKQRADNILKLSALWMFWTFILLLVYCDNALIYFWLNTLSN